MPSVSELIQTTAPERRLLAIRALDRELSLANPQSCASRLRAMVEADAPRPIVASGDIDGVVSATMLASVAHRWDIVAFVVDSDRLLLHPSVAAGRPSDLFGVDVFSPTFDNVSNHVVLFGDRDLRATDVRLAFGAWDSLVRKASQSRLMAVPAVWAATQGGYEDAARPDSSKYKYPFGTAQLMLALLEAAGIGPKFFDRQYLPWLVANCDGGVESFRKYAFNAAVWWPALAGAVGPASHTEQIYQRIQNMRPHDFMDAVNRLDRERRAAIPTQDPWLDDEWNLVDSQRSTLMRTLSWLVSLTGWRDPVLGGIAQMVDWEEKAIPSGERALVYVGGPNFKDTNKAPAVAAANIRGAFNAVNANFYLGGDSGSRFNWVGGSSW